MLRKKRALTTAFTQVDKDGSGYVTKDKWCKVMDNVSVSRFVRLRALTATAIAIDIRAFSRLLFACSRLVLCLVCTCLLCHKAHKFAYLKDLRITVS